MNIKDEILRKYSTDNVNKISKYIGSDQEKFDELVGFFLSGPYRLTQRAAWVLSKCCDKHPELLQPHLEKVIMNMRNPVHDAVKRNVLRVLQHHEIPDHLVGEIVDICFDFLTSNSEPIAIKVFSMTVLYNVCKTEPDLLKELKIVIEDQMPYGSAGFKSRGKKILKALNKTLA